MVDLEKINIGKLVLIWQKLAENYKIWSKDSKFEKKLKNVLSFVATCWSFVNFVSYFRSLHSKRMNCPHRRSLAAKKESMGGKNPASLFAVRFLQGGNAVMFFKTKNNLIFTCVSLSLESLPTFQFFVRNAKDMFWFSGLLKNGAAAEFALRSATSTKRSRKSTARSGAA